MSNIVPWIIAHQAVVSGVVVAMLDLLFALSPSVSGNGLIHQLYVWLKKLKDPSSVQ